jgi:hypothetical protein
MEDCFPVREGHSLDKRSKPSAFTSFTKAAGGHGQLGKGQWEADRGHSPEQRKAKEDLLQFLLQKQEEQEQEFAVKTGEQQHQQETQERERERRTSFFLRGRERERERIH